MPKTQWHQRTECTLDPFPGGEYPRIHLHHTSCYIRAPFSSGLSCDDIVFGASFSSLRTRPLRLKQSLRLVTLLCEGVIKNAPVAGSVGKS